MRERIGGRRVGREFSSDVEMHNMVSFPAGFSQGRGEEEEEEEGWIAGTLSFFLTPIRVVEEVHLGRQRFLGGVGTVRGRGS